MYTMCSQAPFTHGSYLGDTASLSIPRAGPRGVWGEGSTTQRAKEPSSRADRCPPGLGVIPHSERDLQRTPGPGLLVPPLGPWLLPQLGVGAASRPSALRLPQLAWALRGCTWGGFHRRPPFCTFLFPAGSAGAGTRQQGCSVFALRGCYLRSTPALISHSQRRPRVTTGAWSP